MERGHCVVEQRFPCDVTALVQWPGNSERLTPPPLYLSAVREGSRSRAVVGRSRSRLAAPPSFPQRKKREKRSRGSSEESGKETKNSGGGERRLVERKSAVSLRERGRGRRRRRKKQFPEARNPREEDCAWRERRAPPRSKRF